MIENFVQAEPIQRHVGIGDMAVSQDANDILVTHSLGSCIGVSLYDEQAKVGGLIHCMLPMSKMDPNKAADRPFMFTDVGVVALIQSVLDHGADKQRLQVKVAGGGHPMDQVGRFKIGERNLTVLRKVLWKNELLIAGEDTGGQDPRTMSLSIASGDVKIRRYRVETSL